VPGNEDSRATAGAAYENFCFYALQQGDEDQDPPIAIREEFMYDYDDHDQRSDTPDIDIRDGVVLGTAWSTPSYVVEALMHCPNQLSGLPVHGDDGARDDLKRFHDAKAE
jgi:hypothetical protein